MHGFWLRKKEVEIELIFALDLDEKEMSNRKPLPGEKSNISARILSGCIGSLVTSLVVTPLDVVKVRLQANTADGAQTIGSRVVPCPRGCGTFVLFNGQMECVLPRSAVPFFDPTGNLKKPNLSGASELGTFAMVRRIFATEGFRGIYAGLSPTLVMAVPNTVFYYSSYDEIVWRLRQSSEGNWIPLVAGASARLMASTVTAPFEMLRTLQASMVGRSETAPGLWEHMRLIVKTEGVGALYHGLGSTLWRDVPFSAIYWYSLERTKSLIQSGRNLTPIEQSGVTFVSGAISGLIAAAATTPFDVAKSRQLICNISWKRKVSRGCGEETMPACLKSLQAALS